MFSGGGHTKSRFHCQTCAERKIEYLLQSYLLWANVFYERKRVPLKTGGWKISGRRTPAAPPYYGDLSKKGDVCPCYYGGYFWQQMSRSKHVTQIYPFFNGIFPRFFAKSSLISIEPGSLSVQVEDITAEPRIKDQDLWQKRLSKTIDNEWL